MKDATTKHALMSAAGLASMHNDYGEGQPRHQDPSKLPAKVWSKKKKRRKMAKLSRRKNRR
jgi:hypothetical protein